MTTTYREALAVHDIEIPPHLEAQAEVPVLTGVQFQGDVGIIPQRAGKTVNAEPVPMSGIQVVRGEATANTHWLDNGNPTGPPCMWSPSTSGLTLGVLDVPEGQHAFLTHTDEHGCNGIGPGQYRITRQREQADEIRMVAD